MSSFTKLKSGEWGIRGSAGEVVAGKTVVVTKRDGTSKTVTVGRVIWTGDGKALATVGNGSQTRDPKAPGGSEYDGGRRGAAPCYMCGAMWCEGARGGLCDDD